ncbi:TIGR00730 family Rossman fold protein [Solihabitans fulvus]|uniref:Cytokinin riboside 5'-monophosphate phosphoribohydrolase n=1 Tax=Solihabitans fulvus TaxID=1892852 RepID=A0A5B2XL41_9PSEU|nr:TIGR00730 family Rossman fold protein [Solihabitans fulvus]KAA2264036.1 TIGR00730 family Rossman fold protein [Solihabitans fulvus]
MVNREFTVCVYCGSLDTVPQSYLDLATAVGEGIAARGWSLVWGGATASMMGAVARAARAGGARTIGVIPQALVDREIADRDADELIVVSGMRDRKARMDERADAFLTLPGGLGTCEELFEMWTSRYLDMHRRPVVLLDVDDHYKGILAWIDELRSRGFVSDVALGALTVAADVDAALAACAG